MTNFIYIMTHILLPIFTQILLGFIVKKLVNFSNKTLADIQFYIIIPALLFDSMYNTQIDKTIALEVVLHSVLIFLVLYWVSLIGAKGLRYNKTMSSAFTNSICLYNSGNFCLPLVQLLYNNPLAVSIQIIIMTVQSIVTNTIGIYSISAGKKNIKEGLVDVLRVPMIYCIILALGLKALNVQVWEPVLSATHSLGSALVPIALISLGAQLADTKYTFKMPKVYLSNFVRLIISPLLAFLLVRALGIGGMVAEIVVISSAAPTAVNSVLLAIKYESEPEFASQTVFFSTILSAVTVSIVIYLVSGNMGL